MGNFEPHSSSHHRKYALLPWPHRGKNPERERIRVLLCDKHIMEKSHTHITIRGYMLDLHKQVSNAKFLEFLEEARWRHFEGAFETSMFLDLDLAFVVVNINIDYRGAATLGDILSIETSITRLGNKSISLSQSIHNQRNAKEIVLAKSTFVIKDLKKGIAVPISGPIRNLLSKGS